MKERYSVLIIDDCRESAEVQSHYFKQYGHVTDYALSVEEALVLLSENEYSIILTDRFLRGELVEDIGLKDLRAAAINSLIIVYTRTEDMSHEQYRKIISKGADSIMDKSTFDRVVDDILHFVNNHKLTISKSGE